MEVIIWAGQDMSIKVRVWPIGCGAGQGLSIKWGIGQWL